MSIIVEKFEMNHQTDFTEWENNDVLSRKLITQIINMKNQLFLDYQITGECEFLIDFEMFLLLDTPISSSFSTWSARQNPNPVYFLDKEGYYYAGVLMGYKIYYDNDIKKIYCGKSIEEIHRHRKKELRKLKLQKLNEC